MTNELKAKTILARAEQLADERVNFESWWDDCAFFCIPRKKKDRTEGQQLDTTLYDSIGIDSLNIFSAGLLGLLTNPTSQWFDLRVKNYDTSKDDAAAAWLYDATKKVESVFNNSNFYSQIHECYKDGGCFGTACIYSEEDEQDHVRYHTRTLNEIVFSEDNAQRIQSVYRTTKMTAIQAYQKFGATCSKEIKDCVSGNKLFKPFEFIHSVEPRSIRDISKYDSLNKPYSSCYIDKKTKMVVFESGYDENPYAITRLDKNDNEKWGYSPAMNVLSNMRYLNKVKETTIRAAQKHTDPPLSVPHNMFTTPLDFNPNGINFKLRGDSNDKIEPIGNYGNPQIGLDMINAEREIIKNAFFVDAFLAMLQTTKRMTIPEVMERIGEKMLILGPMLGRIMDELLKPVILRTFFILLRRQVIAPPPLSLQGGDLQIEYLSALAKAQKQSQLKAVDNTLTAVVSMASAVPQILDKIDFDNAVDVIADINGAPPSMIRSNDSVGSIREDRQKQQEGIARLQMAQGAVDAAKTLSETDKNLKQGGAAK